MFVIATAPLIDAVVWVSTAEPVVDQEAERDVQPVWLADTAPRPAGGPDHRQHHGPTREDHDQQDGQQTGEEALLPKVIKAMF